MENKAIYKFNYTNNIMKTLKILLLCVLCTLSVQAQKQYKLASPDGKLQTTVTAGKQLNYDITFDGQLLQYP